MRKHGSNDRHVAGFMDPVSTYLKVGFLYLCTFLILNYCPRPVAFKFYLGTPIHIHYRGRCDSHRRRKRDVGERVGANNDVSELIIWIGFTQYNIL